MVGNDTNRAHSCDLHGKLTRHRALSSMYQGINLLDENLYYASGPGTPCYNGSISSMTDCLLNPGTNQNYSGYTFSYDGMNRLLTATSRGGMSLNSAPAIDLTERMEYSVDSSLKKLIRRGKSHTGARTIDSLTIGCGFGRPVLIQEYAATNLLTGTFEVVKSGRHRYYYDDAGSLSRDVSRGMNVSYDLNGNPVFMAYNAGSETEAGYTAGGQKLWTVHRTAAGTIPADVLSDPNKPKPTPEIGTTPSQYSRLSDYLIQSVDVTRYYDGFEFYDRNLTEGKFYFSNGYVSFHTGNSVDYSAIITDYRGSTRVVMALNSTCTTGTVVQANSYYPSGALVTDVQTSVQLGSTSGDVQTRKFLGKELDRMYGLDWYDLGARRYDAAAVTFWTMDPLCEQYYHISPYAYCAGDPVNMIDPDGKKPRIYIETENLGHTFITIGEGKETVVYSYGRYGLLGALGSISGNCTPTGEGVLLRMTGNDAYKYLTNEISKKGITIFEIENAEDQMVASYYDELWRNGTQSTSSKEAAKQGLVIDEYNLYTNNCTTKTIQGINESHKKELIPYEIEVTHYVRDGMPYKSDEAIIAPITLKMELNRISKHSDEIIKIEDPKRFIQEVLESIK